MGLESQRNAAHDIKNDLQEVVGLVSAYDQELISRGNSNNNVDRVLEDPNPNGGHSPSSSNGGLAIQYIEEDPREIYAVPERSTSAGALGGKDTWRTQSELRALAKVQHTPLRKTVLQRKVNASRDGPFQTLTTGETRLGTDHLSTTTRGTKKKKTSSSTKFNQRNSPLDLDVSSRVSRAASRITTRLESNLRDTRTTIQRKLLVPTIKACDLASVIYHDVAYDPLITYERDPDFPSIVETDSAWFRNCLANLVGNAKKHGPKASRITVRLLWLAKSSTIKVEVEDEGKGVSVQQAMRTYITGLGGTVGADGSIFWLKLPILEEPVTMHPLYLTFTGNAEQGFIDYFQPSVAVITLAVSLYLFMTFLTA